MSRYTPKNLKDFRTATARVRNMSEFKIIMAYLAERLETHKEALVDINDKDFPQVQGRAKELRDLITEINKTTEE